MNWFFFIVTIGESGRKVSARVINFPVCWWQQPKNKSEKRQYQRAHISLSLCDCPRQFNSLQWTLSQKLQKFWKRHLRHFFCVFSHWIKVDWKNIELEQCFPMFTDSGTIDFSLQTLAQSMRHKSLRNEDQNGPRDKIIDLYEVIDNAMNRFLKEKLRASVRHNLEPIIPLLTARVKFLKCWLKLIKFVNELRFEARV